MAARKTPQPRNRNGQFALSRGIPTLTDAVPYTEAIYRHRSWLERALT